MTEFLVAWFAVSVVTTGVLALYCRAGAQEDAAWRRALAELEAETWKR